MSFLTNSAGYATGVKNLKSNQLAWTQENGVEAIIRPSDGAILTPLKSGDSVLNNAATNTLFTFANDPTKFIKDNLFDDNNKAYSMNKSVYSSNNISLGNVTFSLPNVSNYQEFLSAMQRDKNFEKFIRSISTDRLFGGSSIKKYNL